MNRAQHPSDRFTTTIWLILVALTIATFSIGEAKLAGSNIMLTLLLIALLKGQMVAHYFMGLRQTHFWWRALIFGFFVIVGGLIALAYLIGMQ